MSSCINEDGERLPLPFFPSFHLRSFLPHIRHILEPLQMSAYHFFQEDWPSTSQLGLAAHYRPNVTTAPLIRGVLHASARGSLAVPWHQLMDCLENPRQGTNNAVSYHVKKVFNISECFDIKEKLDKAFESAFPNATEACTRVFKGKCCGQDGTYITFYPVPKELIATSLAGAAFIHGWKAGDQPLGKPWYVGFETREQFGPLKFVKVPEACKDKFIQALPEYLTEKLDPYSVIEFNGEICVLVCVGGAPFNSWIHASVERWPGWFHFDDEYLIKLEYPGRYRYCDFCRHTAQDLKGRNRRHEEENCIKITCGECGHVGHDVASKKGDATETNKKKCEEGKKRRREEKEEARKRQKLQEEKAEREAAEAEARKEAEEAARRAAEEEEARIKAAEEEAKRKEEEAKKQEEEAKKEAIEEDAEEQAVEDTTEVTPETTPETDSQQVDGSDGASEQSQEPEENDDAVDEDDQQSEQHADDSPDNAAEKDNNPAGEDQERGGSVESEAVVKVEESV
ncbi:uncharacterized protein SRS1_16396 [Sporisorium reilianum f. sp. reilianum]|uniref:Uncharacterized protein n=1 Tax=Sporisorium reilianum f. sp. reilianum TaxID=72559 RepID=A0A2N8UMV7_9BASI|nr:uncharacterized protein SRS1_16396 [Sporisorium reilianum f. sp. reilianum]